MRVDGPDAVPQRSRCRAFSRDAVLEKSERGKTKVKETEEWVRIRSTAHSSYDEDCKLRGAGLGQSSFRWGDVIAVSKVEIIGPAGSWHYVRLRMVYARSIIVGNRVAETVRWGNR